MFYYHFTHRTRRRFLKYLRWKKQTIPGALNVNVSDLVPYSDIISY